MNSLPCSSDLSLVLSHPFDEAFAAALCAVVNTVAAEPTDSDADLLDELDCAVTSLALGALRRQV